MADPLIDDLNLPDRSDVYAAPDPTVPPTLRRLASEPAPSGEFDPDRVQRVQAAALVILATAAVLTLLSVAKLILIVILTSILMAFVLAPVADALTDFRVPRSLSSLIAVFLLLASLATLTYLSYARAVEFMSQMPEYKVRLKHIVDEIRQQAEQVRGNYRNRAAFRAPGQELRHGAANQRSSKLFERKHELNVPERCSLSRSFLS